MAPAKKTVKSRSYIVLRKSTLLAKKKVSSQGKSVTTTKSGAQLAARIALKKTTRPSRIYLYRKKRILTYAITYHKKPGKTRAVARIVKTTTVKRKKPASKKTTKRKSVKKKSTKRKSSTKKKKRAVSKTEKIAALRRRLRALTAGSR